MDEERATIIFNANAGNGDSIGLDEISECVRAQGYATSEHETQEEAELDEILPEATGLVVVAGGDGTISAVCQRVAGRDDVRIVPLPLGTANNLGHALGIAPNTLEAIEDLDTRTSQRMDLGTVSWGERHVRFAEGFGCGIYAELLHRYDPDQGKSVKRALETLMEVLPSFESVHIDVKVDGSDISDEYLLLAVMNTKRIGPQIQLAKDADPCDGKFDVVGIKAGERNVLASYVRSRIAGDAAGIEDMILHRAREVEIVPNGCTFHLDTHTFESIGASDGVLHVEVDAGVVPLLLAEPCA